MEDCVDQVGAAKYVSCQKVSSAEGLLASALVQESGCHFSQLMNRVVAGLAGLLV